MIVAGIGFSSQCQPQELVDLVRRAEAMVELSAAQLAIPAWKQDAWCLHAAAAILSLPIAPVSEDGLAAAADRCVTTSRRSQQRAGVPSVAEAAALAAAGAGGRLELPRIASAHATCALAQGELS